MKLLFSVLLLANAALLFWVELLYGKKILPALGGAPSVWNTCLMFYQVVLLAGYAYAVAVNRLSFRRQLLLHGTVLAVTVAALPHFLFVWPDPGDRAPILFVLALLTLSVGLPLFVLAAGAPLLQRWFSLSGHRERRDPYFLYAASNLGSFLGLAAYPAVFEPLLTLEEQVTAWRLSYALLAAAVVVGGVWALRTGAGDFPSASGRPQALPEKGEASPDGGGARSGPGAGGAPPAPDGTAPGAGGEPPSPGGSEEPVSTLRRLKWIGYAFLPSSLLLGVTTFITGEVAPVPLLWVVPLALYLLTFVVAFGPVRKGAGVWTGLHLRPLPALLGALALGVLVGGLVLAGVPFPGVRWLWVLAHLGMLVLAGLICHVSLARDRPHPRRLPEFYLWIALGGALGGVFNALLAPILFTDPLEYPLALALLAFLVAARARPEAATRPRLSDVVFGAVPGLVAFGLAALAPALGVDARLLLVVPGALCLVLAGRPVRFGLAIAGVVLVGFAHPIAEGEVLHRDRTFYGIHRIYQDGDYRWLAHGTTVHGGQNEERPEEPLTYYHPAGPTGSLFQVLGGREAPEGGERVAVVGLGTGSMITYGREGQEWVFYEIDPAVVEIAEEPRYFTFLQDSPVPYRTVLGDARLSLERTEGTYDLLAVDAFSSEAIPVHLLTREAVELYLSRLRDAGLLAFHISNRYLDLSGVLGDVARDLGLRAYEARDELGDMARGHYPSHWVVLSREEVTFPDPLWRPLEGRGGRVWTDDYSSLLPLMRW